MMHDVTNRVCYGSDHQTTPCDKDVLAESPEIRTNQTAIPVLLKPENEKTQSLGDHNAGNNHCLRDGNDSGEQAATKDLKVQTVIKTILFPNHTVYVGETLDNMPYGRGKMTRPDRIVLEGEFKGYKLNGEGMIRLPDGSVKKGIFAENKLKKGFIQRSEGLLFIGEFENDLLNGIGKIDFGDGRFLMGEFKNNKLDGEGITLDKDGTKTMSCKFEEGVNVGQTIVKRADGTIFEAKFINNHTSHPGKLTLPNKKVFYGKFQDSLFIFADHSLNLQHSQPSQSDNLAV